MKKVLLTRGCCQEPALAVVRAHEQALFIKQKQLGERCAHNVLGHVCDRSQWDTETNFMTRTRLDDLIGRTELLQVIKMEARTNQDGLSSEN